MYRSTCHSQATRMNIASRSCMTMPLGITVGELNGTADTTAATFNDINGRRLSFVTFERPFKRVLLFIAFSAFKLALENSNRRHTLTTAAAPRDITAWRMLFEEATLGSAGSPPLPADGFIMQRFFKDT